MGSPRSRALWRVGPLVVVATLAVGLLVGLRWFGSEPRVSRDGPVEPLTTAEYERRMNCRFEPSVEDTLRAPRFQSVALPEGPKVQAIWGALGRDDRGHIWAGLSMRGGLGYASARLLEYDPGSGALWERGDAVAQLERLGLAHERGSQQKIASRIVQGEDGHLYFTSMDEYRSDMTLRRLPQFGSHVWRVDPRGPEVWEHLFATTDVLTSVAMIGRDLYALGWFGHVLYHQDDKTGRVGSVRVGSVDAHFSRRFFGDHRGHVYVPRLLYTTDSPSRLVVTLVEFNERLEEVGESSIPTEMYAVPTPSDSHGITGFQYLRDRSIVFITHPGMLFRVVPRDDGPARLESLGPMHPAGPMPIESLFTYDGERYLAAVTVPELDSPAFEPEWVVHDLQTRRGHVLPLTAGLTGLTLPSTTGPARPLGPAEAIRGARLMGSITRDDFGDFYLGGIRAERPLLVRVRFEPGTPGLDDGPAPVVGAPPEGQPPGRREIVDRADPPVSTATEPVPTPSPTTPPGPAPAPGPSTVARASPASAAPPLSPGPPVSARAGFHQELREALDRPIAEAAALIQELCERSGPAPTAADRAVLAQARTRPDRRGRVRFARSLGALEPHILLELIADESKRVGARNGPRNRDDAVLRATRLLLSLPVD